MTEQHESRWSLHHTGNRVLLAVAVGLLVGLLGRIAGATGGAHFLVFLLAALATYVVAALFARR